MSPTKFITASELARKAGQPLSRIRSAVEAGHLIPAARAGGFKNSPILFLESDAEAIKTALELGSTESPTTHHICRSASEVKEKHAALVRAFNESAQ
jgi:hypothetical protein